MAAQDAPAIITHVKHTDMRRIYRNDMPQAQKDKIAAANVGKHLSQQTKDKIARKLRQYWAKLPYKPDTDSTAPELPTNPYED